jgi:hypothetical protein
MRGRRRDPVEKRSSHRQRPASRSAISDGFNANGDVGRRTALPGLQPSHGPEQDRNHAVGRARVGRAAGLALWEVRNGPNRVERHCPAVSTGPRNCTHVSMHMFERVLVSRSVTAGKRCHQCSGPFGMVRHHLVTFSGWISFCSKKCKEEHHRHRQQEVRRRKLRELLHAPAIRVSIRCRTSVHQASVRGAGRLTASDKPYVRGAE